MKRSKKVKYTAAQAVMPFATGIENSFVPVCYGGKGPELELDVDRLFDSRAWVKDLLARPVSSREVNS